MRGQLRILIADRNALVVEAIKDLFVELDGGTAVLSAGSLEETLAVARREQPQLIVIDAWMGTDADSAVAQVVACSPGSSVFVMATDCDEEFDRRMRRAGATGCCKKAEMPARARLILDAMEAAP